MLTEYLNITAEKIKRENDFLELNNVLVKTENMLVDAEIDNETIRWFWVELYKRMDNENDLACSLIAELSKKYRKMKS